MDTDSYDLFASKAVFNLPERVGVFGRVEGNIVKRLTAPAQSIEVTCMELPKGRGFRCATADGFTFAVVASATTSLHGCDAVLKVTDTSSVTAIEKELEARHGKWILPKAQKPSSLQSADALKIVEDTRDSWLDAFELREERYDGDNLIRSGLRSPQIGAINATKAHWSVSSKAATLVLPTGTGKTETMLSLLVSERLQKLLVIVPTDQLRLQIAEKFISLGVLKQSGCLSPSALQPTVAILKSAPKTPEALDRLVESAHVIVGTMQVLSGLTSALQARLAEQISHLFVDEAHHIAAKTWRAFKLQFGSKPILQFTATPYRRDGLRVDGKFIYVYPLRRAQKDGLFKPIKYIPVHGLDEDDTDRQIIESVGIQLTDDDNAGFKHLVMARTGSVNRATLLHSKYAHKFPQHKPQLIHSGLPVLERARALRELRDGRSRIIVCVDMLGEGFDLPDLKIAALHDKHRSEAITLQFIGRFTRVRHDLGDATVIANVSIDDVSERLKALYAEDADWNHLLSVTGEAHTERSRRREEVYGGFSELAEEFPLETFEPRISTVVYKTACPEWNPDNFINALERDSTLIEGPFINREVRLLIFVTRDEERLRWTSVKSPRNVEYNMVMAHWDADQNLLFINSSDLKNPHTELAKEIAGEDCERITGEQVFRSLQGFRRLILMNLGLSETQRKPVRYSMFMGSDIADQLETLPGNRTRTLTNLFGQGFIDVEDLDDEGRFIGSWPQKATLGCSTKGKIWSYQSTNSFSEWIDWCHGLGKRLLNESITHETILRNVVRPHRLPKLPSDKTPIAIAWPERFLFDNEERIEIEFGAGKVPFFNCEIEVADFSIDDCIKFRVGDDSVSSEFELRIVDGAPIYSKSAGADVVVHKGKKAWNLIEGFKEDPPHIYFADGDLLVAADLFVLRRDEDLPAFDLAKMDALNWSGVDIRKESQGKERRADSIQRRVIERLQSADNPYDIIFDDDGAGEVADVVAIRRSGHVLTVDLFHCKYSSEEDPGSRVGDLYEVCGQAQKSVRWAERLDEFLHHLRRREGDRRKHSETTRFEKGEMASLLALLGSWRELRPEFSVTIVQPGYSKKQAQLPHLNLFAATESFLMDTWRMKLRVWTSE